MRFGESGLSSLLCRLRIRRRVWLLFLHKFDKSKDLDLTDIFDFDAATEVLANGCFRAFGLVKFSRLKILFEVLDRIELLRRTKVSKEESLDISVNKGLDKDTGEDILGICRTS